MSPEIGKRTLALLAIAVVVLAGVAFILARGGLHVPATGGPAGNLVDRGTWTNGIPTCASGYGTVTYLEPFLAGGVNPQAVNTPDDAAQQFMAEYLRLGRQDGVPIGVVEVKRHDASTFYVPSPEDPDQAQLALKVEEFGGRFAVGSLWACDGALPRWEHLEEDA
jgi:hypothetical protein